MNLIGKKSLQPRIGGNNSEWVFILFIFNLLKPPPVYDNKKKTKTKGE